MRREPTSRVRVAAVTIACSLIAAVTSAVLTAPASAAEPVVDSPIVGREQLHAILWMQTADEYRANSLQAYRLAMSKLAALKKTPGTAAVEQMATDPHRLARLPTAIVLDLDETVLDNSVYQARRAAAGLDYDEASWQAWMQEAAATALPGAREFLWAAARAGHRIFYVTNRHCQPQFARADDACPAKTATMRNLVALGLPFASDREAVSLRSERPGWESGDKGVRRAWIAERYRIVALIGDDLRDFIDRPIFAARRAELEPLFGVRWFVLPNAMYGSWERSLASDVCNKDDVADVCAQKVMTRKYARLVTAPATGK